MLREQHTGLSHNIKLYINLGLYDDLEGGEFRSLSSSLGLPLPNPAPEIDISAKEPG